MAGSPKNFLGAAQTILHQTRNYVTVMLSGSEASKFFSLTTRSFGGVDLFFHDQNSAHCQFPCPQMSAPPIMTSLASKDKAPRAATGAAPGKGKTLICSYGPITLSTAGTSRGRSSAPVLTTPLASPT